MTNLNEFYVVVESLPNEKHYNLRAISSTLRDASEIVATEKIKFLSEILDAQQQQKARLVPYSHELMIVKLTENVVIDSIEQMPKITMEKQDLTDSTRQQLQVVTQQYKDLISQRNTQDDTESFDHLQVHPSLYERDRKSREYELMQRLNIRPMWRGNVLQRKSPGTDVVIQPQIRNGQIPQPVAPIAQQRQSTSSESG
jgi:hypothetical protein